MRIVRGREVVKGLRQRCREMRGEEMKAERE